MTTLAPASAKPKAMLLPNPLAAPVIIAVFPDKLKAKFIFAPFIVS
jgi:hypothetical protein